MASADLEMAFSSFSLFPSRFVFFANFVLLSCAAFVFSNCSLFLNVFYNCKLPGAAGSWVAYKFK